MSTAQTKNGKVQLKQIVNVINQQPHWRVSWELTSRVLDK